MLSGAGGRSAGIGLAAVLLAASIVSMSNDPDPDPDSVVRGQVSPAPSARPSGGLAARCLSLTPPRRVQAEVVTLAAPGMRLAGALVPPLNGPAVSGVVLLPQTGAGGFCGWLPFAEEAARHGVVALPLDLCGYGDSECPDEPHVSEQVDLAVEHLRSEFGVTSVVVAGASMGGAQAVRAVAGGASVTAWADISGPSAWAGEELLPLTPRVRRPGLVVRARRDGDPAELHRARRLARRTGAAFESPASGHGWDLLFDNPGRLSRIGERLLDLVCGGSPRCLARGQAGPP